MKQSHLRWEQGGDDSLFNALLTGERGRLIRYCARFVEDSEIAEDLAQETLLEALRHQEELRTRTSWRSWLMGIAHNVCLRFIERRKRERARRVDSHAYDFFTNQMLDSSEEPLKLLERNEREHLLDRALGKLPADSRQLLVERYLEDKQVSELEARYGLTENHLHVRLHRSRTALRHILFSDDFREEVKAYGLRWEGTEAEGWQITNIWCPRCGQIKLEGRFTLHPENPMFEVRCTACRNYLGPDFSSNNPQMNVKQLLGGLKGFKPALNRVHQWWWKKEQSALTDKSTTCLSCNKPVEIHFSPPPGLPMHWKGRIQFFMVCPHCRKITGPSALGMALVHPEVQQFWRRHPRIRSIQGSVPIRLNNGSTGTLATFESVTSGARIEMLFSDTNATLLETWATDTSDNLSLKEIRKNFPEEENSS